MDEIVYNKLNRLKDEYSFTEGTTVDAARVMFDKIRFRLNILEDIGIRFTRGTGIVDIVNRSVVESIEDRYVVLGLSEEMIEQLSDDSFFEKHIRSVQQDIKGMLSDLRGRHYSILNRKCPLTEELGIYTKIRPDLLLRKIYKQKIENVRVGSGYHEKAEQSDAEDCSGHCKYRKYEDVVFAVIDKIPMNSNEYSMLSQKRKDKGIRLVNSAPSSQEKKNKQGMIFVEFRVRPFDFSGNISNCKIEDYFKKYTRGSARTD